MRVLILGGTRFIGPRLIDRLLAGGHQTLAVHRHPASAPVGGRHLLADRRDLRAQAGTIRDFAPEAVVDTCAMTGANVEAVLPVLPDVPSVVLSSQDVYEAHAALVEKRPGGSAMPLEEDAPLREQRYPYRGAALPDVPDDYSKQDVEERWLDRGAVALRLPMVYGPGDPQRREDVVLRRLRAGRTRIPVGPGTLLWTRGHVDDVTTAVLAALRSRAADGLPVNLGERATVPLVEWFQQIIDAVGSSARLERVEEGSLPPDLALTAVTTHNILASVARARDLLGVEPGDPASQVSASARWHWEHAPDQPTWTAEDERRDDRALDTAG